MLIPSPSETLALNAVIVMSFTLLVYEYCLTLSLEVERFWSSKRLTWSSFLFYLNRYFTLCGHVPLLAEYFLDLKAPSKLTICRGLLSYTQFLAMVVEIIVGALLILRTYALYAQNRKVLALLLAVTFVGIGIACWFILIGKKESRGLEDYLAVVGCPTAVSQSNALRYAAAWSGKLIFDVLVFGLTVYRSMTLRRVSGSSALTLMLRDGSMYFGIMVAATLANMLMLVYGRPFTRGIITTPMNVVSSIMITRLMLNLRDPKLTAVLPCSLGTTLASRDTHILSTIQTPSGYVETLPAETINSYCSYTY